MNSERFQKASKLFNDARHLRATLRVEYLDRECGEDSALRDHVLSLLGHHDSGDGLFDKPILRLEKDGACDEQVAVDADSTIGPYRILDKIGEGGMGVVYLAEQDHPKRRVALKLVRPGLGTTENLGRFRLEANTLASLQHIGIARILEAGEGEVRTAQRSLGFRSFLAMEYVEGHPLDEYAEKKNLGIRERLELVALVCDALAHAHDKGVIHRDIKPGNILVDGSGQPKLLDFGVARPTECRLGADRRHTRRGELIGTLPYMSPEQVLGNAIDIDVRSDVYALGVVLFELLAGRLPCSIEGLSLYEAQRKIREEEPPRLGRLDASTRGDVETIVAKAIEKDRGRRYASPRDLAGDIRRYFSDEPILARPSSSVYQLRKFAKRHRGIVIGSLSTCLALVVGVVVSILLAMNARDAAERAAASEADARLISYRTSLRATEFALRMSDHASALQSLEGAPGEYRGWEWEYLRARLDNVVIHVDGDGGVIADVTILEDGKALGALVRNGALQVFDLQRGQAIFERGLDRKVIEVEFSRSGSHVVTTGAEGDDVSFWDIPSGVRVRTIPVGKKARLTISPDGSFYLISKRDRVSLFESTSGEVVWSFSDGERKHLRSFVDFSPNGEAVAWVTRAPGKAEPRLRLLDVRGARVVQDRFVDGTPCGVAFSPDGALLAVRRSLGVTTVFDATDLSELYDIPYRSFHPRGRQELGFLARNTRLIMNDEDSVQFWDLSTRTLSHVMDAPGHVFNLSPELSGNQVALSGRDWVQLRDVRPEPSMVLGNHTSYVYAAVYSPDGSLIATGGWDQRIWLWDAATGESLGGPLTCPSRLRHLAFSEDGTRLVVKRTKHTYVWDLLSGEQSRVLKNDPSVRNLERGGSKWAKHDGQIMALSSDGTTKVRAVRGHDPNRQSRRIEIVDTSSLEPIGNAFPGRGSDISAVVFSRDGSLVASGGRTDGSIRIWDVATARELARLETGSVGEIFSLSFSPDGKRLASVGRDGVIRLWCASRYRLLAELKGHGSYIHSVTFSPDGSQIVSASGDGTARVWDTVSRGERVKRARDRRSQRENLEPTVLALLTRLEDPNAVVRSLRDDESVDPEAVQLAIDILIRRHFRSIPSDV